MSVAARRRRRAGGGAAGATITYIGSATSTSNLTTYNFGNFVTSSGGMLVAVFTALGGSARTVASVSIGGSAGTLITGASNQYKTAIGTREISAGTHNVTFALDGSNGTSGNASVSVYLVENYTSATAHDTDTTAGKVGSSMSVVVDTPADGVAVFGAIRTGTAEDGTWSAATNDYSVALNGGSGDRQHEHASDITTAETPRTETVTYSTSQAGRVIGASWA